MAKKIIKELKTPKRTKKHKKGLKTLNRVQNPKREKMIRKNYKIVWRSLLQDSLIPSSIILFHEFSEKPLFSK